MKNMGMNN